MLGPSEEHRPSSAGRRTADLGIPDIDQTIFAATVRASRLRVDVPALGLSAELDAEDDPVAIAEELVARHLGVEPSGRVQVDLRCR